MTPRQIAERDACLNCPLERCIYEYSDSPLSVCPLEQTKPTPTTKPFNAIGYKEARQQRLTLIEELTREEGLPASDLAKAANIPPSTIRQWRREERLNAYIHRIDGSQRNSDRRLIITGVNWSKADEPRQSTLS